MKKDKIIVVGDACVDVLIPLDELAGKMMSEASESAFRPSLSGGGTASNTAVALKKLGHNVSFMGTLGCDYGGRFFLDEFKQENINTEFVIEDPKRNTVYCFAFIDPSGEREIWAFPRTDVSYTELDLNKVDMDEVVKAKWMHSSGMNYLMDGNIRKTLPELFKRAYESGVITSFDLNTRAGRPEDIEPEVEKAVRDTIPYVNYLLGSAKDEFYSFNPQENFLDSARGFVSDKRTVIARLGSKGAVAMTPDEEYSQEPFDVKVVDTVGAGDAFNAGFIAAKASGLSLFDALTWGNAVASYKVSGNSSRHTPNLSQLEEFISRYEVEKYLKGKGEYKIWTRT
jgi:sugar/nucleoside kinase (ribokinase family)